MNFNSSYVGSREDLFGLIPADSAAVLDVGCAVGALGRRLKERNPTCAVDGIELDSVMGGIAAQTLDRVFLGEAEAIVSSNVLSRTYDCLVCGDVLEHMKDPGAFLRAARQHLTGDGITVASIPNVRHWSTAWSLLAKGTWPQRDRGIHDRTHLRWFCRHDIYRLFDESGYDIVSLSFHLRVKEAKKDSRRQQRLYPILRLPHLVEFFVFQYLVVARAKRA